MDKFKKFDIKLKYNLSFLKLRYVNEMIFFDNPSFYNFITFYIFIFLSNKLKETIKKFEGAPKNCKFLGSNNK